MIAFHAQKHTAKLGGGEAGSAHTPQGRCLQWKEDPSGASFKLRHVEC